LWRDERLAAAQILPSSTAFSLAHRVIPGSFGPSRVRHGLKKSGETTLPRLFSHPWLKQLLICWRRPTSS